MASDHRPVETVAIELVGGRGTWEGLSTDEKDEYRDEALIHVLMTELAEARREIVRLTAEKETTNDQVQQEDF